MTLIDNLNAINDCKDGIKTALINKGVDMTGVAFSDYAVKIDELQLSSGDEPSIPTPSADYIYSNGYIDGTTPIEIITFVPYEIVLGNRNDIEDVEDIENKFILDLTSPEEIPGYLEDGVGYRDIIFTVDVPSAYKISQILLYNELDSDYTIDQPFKVNPRYDTVVRNGVSYESFVRLTSDEEDYGSADVQYAPLKYRIIIEKK